MYKNIILATLFILVSAPFLMADEEEENTLTWPREMELENVIITLYQPQLESFDNNVLTGRMALSAKTKDDEMFFGALWFSAIMETDLDNRIVLLKTINIEKVHFPDAKNKEVIEHITRLMEQDLESKDIEMSLDRLLAGLDITEQENERIENFNNAPPVIHFRTEPSILIYIDGDPVLKDTDETGYEYVVNTPFFIVRESSSGKYYIKGGKWWFSSPAIADGWESINKAPKKVKKLADKAMGDVEAEEDSAMMAMKEAPELIVSTIPAELIMVDGEPEYTPVDQTSLLYVKNTESDIIMDINTQQYYVLLAGRWYTSKTLQDDDWQFVEPKNLPEDFTRIPKESDMANVRSSVPGTDEAKTAMLEQTIPQTATVDRATATVEVKFDGNPKFEKVESTSVAYAVNCDKTVLLIDNVYYCVDDGIWFESSKATGPYEVSIKRPDEVDEIPPESPVYNVKYVYIYDYTPTVVYVGYTPGYTCSYVYSGVVVYGTGYYYQPWYGAYYYPRPVTWGFGVHYNPWTGWGFSVGVSYGWLSISFGRSYGYWGPRGYRGGYRHGYHRGYHHGYNRGYSAGARAGYRAGSRSSGRSGGTRAASNNVYRNRANGVQSTGVRNRATQTDVARNRAGNVNRAGTMDRQARPASRDNVQNRAQTRPSNKSNNVYSDRSGNVQRRDNSGNWEQRRGGNWENRSGSNQQMNRDHQSRQQGSTQQRNYNQSRSRSGGASRPSGGSRGGGGRRR
ncbi:MAG: hypothetical protein U9R60_09220 [Bacteroidota bacterium]|nr:hypothetical protein [Bacteroidota bacterium]